MRKVFTVTQNGFPGVYVEWYDAQKRRGHKYFTPHCRKLASADANSAGQQPVRDTDVTFLSAMGI